MNDPEQVAYAMWRDQHRQYRVTGWTVWEHSLMHRGVKDIQVSRSYFDDWLASVRLTDWVEFDAWMAAARFASHIPLTF